MSDFYAVLGVAKTATQDEIKAAYRALARQWHPDKHQDPEKKKEAEEKFKEIGAAYETLNDPGKRDNYDRQGENPFAAFMNNFRVVRREPKDTIGTIEIDLIDAAAGATRKVTIEHEVACEACDGTGSSTKKKRTCQRCNGSGQLNLNHGNHAFMFTQAIICPGCSGHGQIPEAACPACSGAGQRTKMDTLELTIPPGVDNRHVLKATKMGRHGGDLMIYVIVRRHPKFERRGNDLHCSVEIPFRTALIGGKISTTGLNEEQVELNVPRGCQYGAEVAAQGKGICGGHLVAKVYFQVPCLPDHLVQLIATLLPS